VDIFQNRLKKRLHFLVARQRMHGSSAQESHWVVGLLHCLVAVIAFQFQQIAFAQMDL
jgi:hypothetical protein